MIDLILMLIAFLALLAVMLRIVTKYPLALNASLTPRTPVTKKFKVKITGNSGEKLTFSSLPEEDVKRVIETLVALRQDKKKE